MILLLVKKRILLLLTEEGFYVFSHIPNTQRSDRILPRRFSRTSKKIKDVTLVERKIDNVHTGKKENLARILPR